MYDKNEQNQSTIKSSDVYICRIIGQKRKIILLVECIPVCMRNYQKKTKQNVYIC